MTYKEIETDFASDLEIVTHLTIPDELRNSNYDIEDLWGDWQSENALDSIRNSCEVYIFQFLRGFYSSLTQKPILGKQAEGYDVRGTCVTHALSNMQVYK